MTNYPLLPGLTADGQIYYNAEMHIAQAMLPPGPWPTAHGPALLETPKGTMLAVWFAGTYEGECDINIVVSRLEKGSSRWSEPALLSHNEDRSDQNPSLFLAPTGEIWALYTSQRGREPGKDNMQYTSQIKRQVSLDDGLSWSEPEIVFGNLGTFARQPIQIVSSGRWIYATWLCSDSEHGLAGDPTAFMISDDAGKSWRQVMMPGSAGRVHAQVVEIQPGLLRAYMRSRDADWIYMSTSTDDGSSWTEPVPTELPNNNSSISALRLASGRVAIAYNHSQAPQTVGTKGAWPGLRCPVSVALSEDGGLSFPFIRHIERGEGYVGALNRANNRQYEYPYLMQAADGTLHLIYAYQTRRGVAWAKFCEEDVLGSMRGDTTYNPTSGEGVR